MVRCRDRAPNSPSLPARMHLQHGRVGFRCRSQSVFKSISQRKREVQLEGNCGMTRVDNCHRVRDCCRRCDPASNYLQGTAHQHGLDPAHTSRDWRFSTSNSGWTSDSHAYEWLTTVFEPETRPEDPEVRRLLIKDGHGSHITANVYRALHEERDRPSNSASSLLTHPATSRCERLFAAESCPRSRDRCCSPSTLVGCLV